MSATTETPPPSAEPATRPPRARLAVGGTVFFLGVVCPAFVPLAVLAPLPAAWKAALSGALVVGIPELLFLAAAAILGKPGFAWLAGRTKRALRRVFARFGPPARVGRARYRFGLALFVAPILFGSLLPYASEALPGFRAHRVLYGAACNLAFVASLFVLGGEFWDKLRALFIHRARAVIPPADE